MKTAGNGVWKQVAVILLAIVISGGVGRLWGESVASGEIAGVKNDIKEIRAAITNLYELLLEERYGGFRDDDP